MIKFVAPLALLSLASPVIAQSFDVSLGGKTLGVMQFAHEGKSATLRSTLDSTPMGVFNGTFSGSSTGTVKDARFTSESRSSRKQRDVLVETRGGRAVTTDITPQEERTALSDTAAVPAHVMDPVRIFAALVGADGCPDKMQMYDGRRVVTLSPSGSGEESGTLSCSMNYRVTAGPGHLSPLGISNAKISLLYTINGDQQSLQKMQISSGLFRVSLDRTD